MSLEEALNAHTAALNHLAEAIRGSVAGAAAQQAQMAAGQQLAAAIGSETLSEAATRSGRGRRAAAPASITTNPLANGAVTAATTAANATVATIKYDPDIREGVLKVAEVRGHAAAVALLARFGVKSGKELKVEQYPAVLAAVAQELAAAGTAVA